MKESGNMIDQAIVDTAATFAKVWIAGAMSKDEFVSRDERDRLRAAGQAPAQKKNKAGVPIWRVELMATTVQFPDRSDRFTVSYAAEKNPMEGLSPMTEVAVSGLVLGFIRRDDGKGYTPYWTVKEIEAADEATKSKAYA
ncbi:hypothetical protein ACL02T_34480 [Pseudonocardia sp. RS010]|uniref:hypothetical protein n=1 Tax=Pseudonocardia sp. RS010 TaxID=3385979 RepID=UPI0039A0C280